ncbi:MAG: ABC transporter permease [Campylobacterota bacterium]
MAIIKIKQFIAPLFGVLISIPLLYLLYFALSHGIVLEDLKNLNLDIYTKNTLILVVGVAFLVLILGGISAYLVSRFEFLGSKFFSVALVLPLAIPSYVVGYTYNGLFEYYGLLTQLTGVAVELDMLNMYGAIFVFGISMFPYLFIVAKAGFLSMSNSVVEVVKLQGIGPVRAFFRAYVPLVYPAFFIGIFLTSLEVISDYATVVYFGIQTFSVGIFNQWFGYVDLEGAVQIAIVLMVFVFAFLLLESKAKQRMRYSSASFSSQKLQKQKLTRVESFFAFSFCFVLFTLSFVLPVAVLIYWSYLDIANFSSEIMTNYFNTLSLNVISSFLIMTLAFIILFFTIAYKTKLSQIAYRVSLLGYSIPGAVVGIGALLFFNSLDDALDLYLFGGTFFVLVFAYLVRFYPAGVGSLNSGFSKVTGELSEAAKLYGKGEFHRLYKIYLPMVKGAFISGFLIVFIDISKELPATLLLRPFNFDTLATRIYELSANEMLPSLGIPSLLLLSMTVVAVLLLNLRIFR